MKFKKPINLKKLIHYKLNDKLVEKIKAVRVLIYFFALMLIFTVLSRFSDSLTIPRVTTTRPTAGTIEKIVNGEGVISENKEEHITTIEEIIVDNVNVSQGQKVKEGDVLFQLSLEDIKGKIDEINKQVSEKNTAINRATEDYNIALAKENNNIKVAEEAMNKAKADLDSASEEELEMLQSSYNEAKKQYKELVNNKESNLLSYERAIEDLKNDTTTKDLKARLAKLNEVQAIEGKITAPRDSYITKVYVEAGGVTTNKVAVSMADEDSGYKFTTQISKKSEKYLVPGETVQLSMANGRDYFDNLTIDSVKKNEENPEMLDVTVKLPKGKGIIGESASLTIPIASKKYPVCVPLDALHSEGNNYYVLVIDEAETVLGKEVVATKVDIQIAEKNSKVAALKDGPLGNYQEIIIGTNKSIKSGDRVRKESK